MTNITPSTYDEQAARFVERTSLRIEREYLGHRPHSPDDVESRAVWNITVSRDGKTPFTFTFGQSIVDSYALFEGSKHLPMQHTYWNTFLVKDWIRKGGGHDGYRTLKPLKIPPSHYDILTCIEKNDPGSFKDFCADYGCSDDSIKARDVYLAVQEEWHNVDRLFSAEELEELRDIQ